MIPMLPPLFFFCWFISLIVLFKEYLSCGWCFNVGGVGGSAQLLSVGVVKEYLGEHIFPRWGKKTFLVWYLHTGVQRSENFPGISALRWINDAIPINVRDNLQTVYFLNPGLQTHLFLAHFGHFLFSGG